MKASDVMVRKVVTTHPRASVSRVAKQLVDNDISALPVVDDTGRLVGIISEADLMRREELGSEKTRPWWLEAMIPGATLAKEFAQSHGKRVEELMSSQVITATEDASLGEIASLLERHRIKRVPILKDGKLVGIVSRSNWSKHSLRRDPRGSLWQTMITSFVPRLLPASGSNFGRTSASEMSSLLMALPIFGVWSDRLMNERL